MTRAGDTGPSQQPQRQRPLRVLPIPEHAPPVLTMPQVLRPYGPTATQYVQGTLAVQFGPDPDDERAFGLQHTAARDLPDPQAWTAHIAQAVVEVLAGSRPAPQLIRWTAPDVYAGLARRHAYTARRGPGPVRRAVVRRVRVCVPADGVVEACAVVLDGNRVRAIAMRLEGLDRRWLITQLQVG